MTGYKFKFILAIFAFLSMATRAETLTLPLYDIYPVEATDLRCIDSKYNIPLPIPDRWDVKRASLKFSYINSASLLRKNSQLVVRLNGTPLAQMKLDPNAPEAHAEIDLPKLLLQPGYNELTFHVSQHYSEQCELPCAPELWTRIKLDEAEISFEYDLKPVPLSIAAIANFLFDAKNISKPKVNMITESGNQEVLTLGGVVASGVAIRYDYRPVQFSTSEKLNLNMDNVLLGTSEFVADFLSQYDISIDISKPHIQVFHLPYKEEVDGKVEIKQNLKRALLVITGVDAKQLQIAVKSFDILSLPFPDSNKMQVHEFELPEIALYSGKQMITPGAPYPFKKLSYETFTFRGFSSGNETLNFRVPPDFLIKPNQYVDVSLNFAYGAGFRVDSVLKVELNGHYVYSIHLDNPRGALVSNYKVSLPTYLFEGGINELSFSPVLTPLITENCSFIHAENLFLTLFDSSSLTFPEMPHQIEMPRLDLLFVNGFPFTRWPDGYQTLVLLPEIDNHHLAAAYNMISILSQKNGYPLLGMKIATEVPANFDGEILMIGTLDTLPKRYLELAPLKFGDLNRVPYPVYQGLDKKTALAFNTQESKLGLNKGVLMQFESPEKNGRSVVMLVAKNGEAVERLSLALQDSSVQAAAKFDLALIDFIEDQKKLELTGDPWRYAVSTVNAGGNYLTGKGGKISPAKSVLTTHPYFYWGLVALVILLLGWTLTRLLGKQKNKRNPDGHDDV